MAGSARPVRRPKSAGPRRAAANKARGEAELVLAGTAYRLRPSYAACQAMEDATGHSLLELMRRANACALQLVEIGAICGELIRAGAADDDKLTSGVSDERIAELIYEEGTSGIYPLLTLVLAEAVSGGRTSSGEARAVTI